MKTERMHRESKTTLVARLTISKEDWNPGDLEFVQALNAWIDAQGFGSRFFNNLNLDIENNEEIFVRESKSYKFIILQITESKWVIETV